MALSPISAAAFYNAAKPATKAAGPDSTQTQDFGKVVKDFTETLNSGEKTAKAALTGNADLPSLVEALASSEFAVEMAVTIRDKVVEAYQEILRMPV